MKATMNVFKELFWYFLGIFLIGLLFYFFMYGKLPSFTFQIPKTIRNLNTIFISILLEAIPFVLLGVIVSSLIQMYISEEKIQKYIPKNPLLALFPAAILGIFFPVCECAIVPIVRRLIKKGMPLHVGMVLLVGAPILNPIVFLSTYFAFQMDVQMAYERIGLAFVTIIIIGLLVYLIFENRNQLKWTKEDLAISNNVEPTLHLKSLKTVFYHASDEFFQMGKYLIFGAFIASLFQTYFDRNLLLHLGSNNIISPPVMMGFAYALSLCSEADAFVAASFIHSFSKGSILAFLLFGPMIDFKNTLMLFGYFKTKFVLAFMVITTVVVLSVVYIFQSIVLR